MSAPPLQQVGRVERGGSDARGEVAVPVAGHRHAGGEEEGASLDVPDVDLMVILLSW